MSSSLKWALFFVFLVGLASFFFAIKFAGFKRDFKDVLIVSDRLPEPESNAQAGFYPEPFRLVLNAPKGYSIYFTLNGAQPNLNSERYSKPILISGIIENAQSLSTIPTSPRWKPPIGDVYRAVVLRAILVSNDNQKSQELVQTFFIGPKKYTLPVMALTVNADDLFGFKDGIYVMGKNYEDKRDYIKKKIPLNLNWWEYPSNYLKRGDNSERPVHIEYFNLKGSIAFQTFAGLRINGNATRGFGQKSLRVCMDQKYGAAQLNFPLFPGNPLTQFNSFILRNGGNDWDKTLFRDAFMQSLLKEAHLDIQSYQPVIVFINGEYWGIHSIRERFDENYLSNKYKTSKDSLAILELGGNLFFGKKEDATQFQHLVKFLKDEDLSKDVNYQEVSRQIDVNSFMDFIIANVYFCNSDWPNNNVKFWRYKTDAEGIDSLGFRDGRWRWMLYDTDWGFGYTGDASVQMNLLEKAKTTGSVGIVFSALLKNETFVKAFQARFEYHLNHTFSKNNVLMQIESFEKELDAEMQEHINRWRVIGSYSNWKSNVKALITFEEKRPDIQRHQLLEFLGELKKGK